MEDLKKGKWIQVINPEGIRGEIHESEADLLNQGFKKVSPDVLESERVDEAISSPEQKVQAAGEGVLLRFLPMSYLVSLNLF